MRVIKAREMRWVGHEAHRKTRNVYKFYSENLKERDNLGDLGVDGSVLKVVCQLHSPGSG